MGCRAWGPKNDLLLYASGKPRLTSIALQCPNDLEFQESSFKQSDDER